MEQCIATSDRSSPLIAAKGPLGAITEPCRRHHERGQPRPPMAYTTHYLRQMREEDECRAWPSPFR